MYHTIYSLIEQSGWHGMRIATGLLKYSNRTFNVKTLSYLQEQCCAK